MTTLLLTFAGSCFGSCLIIRAARREQSPLKYLALVAGSCASVLVGLILFGWWAR